MEEIIAFGMTASQIAEISDKLAYTNCEGRYIGPPGRGRHTARAPGEYDSFLKAVRRGHKALMSQPNYFGNVRPGKTRGAT